MSRYSLKPKNTEVEEVIAGFDSPFEEFFFQLTYKDQNRAAIEKEGTGVEVGACIADHCDMEDPLTKKVVESMMFDLDPMDRGLEMYHHWKEQLSTSNP